MKVSSTSNSTVEFDDTWMRQGRTWIEVNTVEFDDTWMKRIVPVSAIRVKGVEVKKIKVHRIVWASDRVHYLGVRGIPRHRRAEKKASHTGHACSQLDELLQD